MDVKTILQEYKSYIPKAHGGSISSLNMADLCHRKRLYTEAMEGESFRNTEKGSQYYRVMIVKSTIKYALIYGLTGQHADRKAVMNYMITRYPECKYQVYQQQQEILLHDHQCIMRYLKEEVRKPSFPAGKDIVIGDETKFIHPDVVFACGDQAEAVWHKTRQNKAWSQTPKKSSFDRYMQLYAGVLYLRELGYKNIKASYYFLEKKSDKPNWFDCDQSFFGDTDNIISTSDIWCGIPDDLDKQMQPYLQMLKEGVPSDSLEEKDCLFCDCREFCKYTLPAKSEEK